MDNRGAIAAACIISLGLCISVSIHSFGDQIQNYFFPELARVYAQPTAAEVFEMRSKCAARVDVFLKSEAGAVAQYGISKYDPKTNRCFVKITVITLVAKDTLRIQKLYDGQTLEILADSYLGMGENNKHMDYAFSYMSRSQIAPDVRFEIEEIMKDDRKQ